MKPIITLLFLLLSLCVKTYAGTLKGKVKDANGEALPFATVYIQGTTNGTTANAYGIYQLYLAPGSYKVTCQYMGFKQSVYNVTVKGDEEIGHDFTLQEQAYEMNAVVVNANAEDPAYAIIRKAIAKRQFHLDQARSFQSSLYLKGVFRNRKISDRIMGIKISDEDKKEMASSTGFDSLGRGIWYLCEEEADYYSRGDKVRTVIKSVRESGNPNGLGIANVPPVITFYENNVTPINGVSPRGFVSPVSDNALHYYKYRFEGSFMENGHMIDKITVIPKRQYEPLLQGTIYIVEEDWAIYSLDLFATTKYNLEVLDTLRVEQTHLSLAKDTWVIKSQVINFSLGMLGFELAGDFVTVYNNQKVNPSIADSIFDSKYVHVYEEGANKKDTSYWTDKRPIPLQEDEVKNYAFKDSVHARVSSPEYKDSVRRSGNKLSASGLLTGYTYNTKEYKNSYSFKSGLIGMVNYNTVEGLVLAPKFGTVHKTDSGKRIEGDFAVRYGFGNKHFNGIARYFYEQGDLKRVGRYWRLGVQGGRYVFQFNPQSTITPLYNTVTTLLQGKNYMKIYERYDGALFFEKNHGNGLKWKTTLHFQKRIPLANTVRYAIKKEDTVNLTSNYPKPLQWVNWEEHNAALFKFFISYQPGYVYTKYPDYIVGHPTGKPIFSLSYEKGIPDILDSKVNFDKWRFGISDNVSLKLLGSFSYDIAAGGFINKQYVSLPDMMHIADNQVVIAAPYLKSFQLAPYYRYSNMEELYGELHLEYYLKGLLTNKVPLLRQAKWYLVLGTNTFYAGLSDYYSEGFISVNNLGWGSFRFLRVDFVQGWDNFNQSYTGVRIGLDVSTLGGSAIDVTVDNWE